jgi:exopolyphosphatase/guanosine-5'-triphosphate,3'-diphosphate pyrophosphatase
VNGPTVAVIDLGTICTRLLIVGPSGELRRSPITNMGADAVTSGRLGSVALDRVGAALRSHRSEIDAAAVDAVRAIATSAARSAADVDALADLVRSTVGVDLEVLDGDTEGRLTFAGAVTGLGGPTDRSAIVIDIGGGSTEFAYGTAHCEASISLDVGSVRLSEMYLHSDPPAPEELSNCITYVGAWLDDIDREMPQARQANMVIGVAGTISTAVAIEIGLAEYDRDAIHHFELTRSAAEDVFRTLATERREDRAHNPGLPAGRIDTIVGGMSILVRIMRHFDLDRLTASESDFLDGLARSVR